MKRPDQGHEVLRAVAKKHRGQPGMWRANRLAQLDEDTELINRASIGDIIITVVVICGLMLGLLYFL